MRARTLMMFTALAVGVLAAPALASSPRVRVHVGLGWWYPGWWWWGPTWAPTVAVASGGIGWTVVDTDVSPEQARVLLDGKLIGTADDFDGFPDYLYLRPPGRYELEFRLDGYKPATVTVEATEHRYVPIHLKLERLPGERRPAWYERPAGLPVGRAFEKERQEAAAAGEEATGAASPTPVTRLDLSLRPELAARPQPRPGAGSGVLVLVVQPANAAVYLDGQFMGTAAELARLERGVSVTSGQHVVEALAPGFVSRAVTVEVEDGGRQQVVIELERRRGEGG